MTLRASTSCVILFNPWDPQKTDAKASSYYWVSGRVSGCSSANNMDWLDWGKSVAVM